MFLTLGDLIHTIPLAWSAETRGKETFRGKSPAAGQCTVSSLLIQRHCGGIIMACAVGRAPHYFNDINGVWIDVTRQQFPRTWPYRSLKKEPAPSSYIFSDTWDRVELLEQRCLEILHG